MTDIKTQLKTRLEDSLKEAFASLDVPPSLELEIPIDKKNGDFASNIAMKSSKIFKKNPIDVANHFVEVFEKAILASPLKDKIAKIEVRKPGFINFFLTHQALYETLERILSESEDFGRSDFGKKAKMQIEFVSANPTGPLSVAHARQAAVGDALANVLNFIGFKTKKEFYVNDEGNQINILGRSILFRAREIVGETVQFPDEGYQGDYIKDMAQFYISKHDIKTAKDLEKHTEEMFREFGVGYLLNVIKKELDDFGVHFDIWSHQSKIATTKSIEEILKSLDKKGFLYEKDGALWFKTTALGDDKDRVVKKSDGSYTYLTPDIVYHKNKFDRGFERVINIWGPDHHGYIPRIKATVQALGLKKEALEVLIVQLATIFREGKPVSMSTRRGQYISLREVMEEVGVDAARFFFLMRHISAHLEFDLDLAKKQSPENPVYYIQYAHARVFSINRKAQETQIKPQNSRFSLLKEEEEMDLIKIIGNFPEVLLACHTQLDPYPLVNFLHELAIKFHKFYDRHRVIDEHQQLSAERLGLVNAVRIVIGNGLRLLGVTAVEKM